MVPTSEQTAFERFLLGLATPAKWFGFVAGCVGVLPLLIALFFSSGVKLAFAGIVGGGFGVFALAGLVCSAVKSGLLHGWASTRELNALLRREKQVTKLLQEYQDDLGVRKASEELLRELGAPSETLNRIRQTSAELERLRAQRQQILQG
ncbi:MAG: hypothetical protein COZ06_03685 [Armatimonadetes bacterium CG_4_10_14_3_um_filter_66_18]|nr:hypothetical protein [Armatimonadota bacterium]OIP09808.1 MAG: hypothetical protein AUJ96_04640 [Armatimonadetes bacterium CG2_30_66_41]PIU93411.1 MAG: hypothetical protein COS65_12820 [Armatimonadetes bacterium CG06_land_8_20_14_3_00_66_21]PIX44671.1 MAG: hypothetical protein COZ57_17030 [Armatimonadetes bacterium CG_4_8_14_3_um_filter_66_20]PIY51991.1 MAG: hypothetical protein COZ06_03685 [Armatimonadetes bacterium CG_4_10_14_3_um_filter_66_18]PIZ40436.1 MAG: hypothetical protein COY42_21